MRETTEWQEALINVTAILVGTNSHNILDSVSDLINRTYVYLNCLFIEITLDLLIDNSLPVSNLKWERKPYRKKDLDKLCELSNEMNDDEIKKRIRATTFPGKPGPHYIE